MTDVVGESVVEQRGIQGALDWLGQLDKKQVNMQSAYNSVIKRAIPEFELFGRVDQPQSG